MTVEAVVVGAVAGFFVAMLAAFGFRKRDEHQQRQIDAWFDDEEPTEAEEPDEPA